MAVEYGEYGQASPKPEEDPLKKKKRKQRYDPRLLKRRLNGGNSNGSY